MPYFTSVVATDASAEQIASAASQVDVEFRVASADVSELESGSVDLITVAQALHWFNMDSFFEEACRVLKPGGVLAVWCYTHCEVDPACDAVIQRVFAELDSFWPPERDIVEARYEGLKMPMAEIPPEEFDMRASWTADDMLEYMHTWSASQRYKAEKCVDATEHYADELRDAWGHERRTVRWPITLRLGRR